MSNISFNMLRTTLVDIPYYSVNFSYQELTDMIDNAETIKADNNYTPTGSNVAQGILMTFDRIVVDESFPTTNNWANPNNYLDENISSQLRAIFIHRVVNKISPLRTLYDQSPHNTGTSQFIKTDGSLTGEFTVYQQPLMPEVSRVVSIANTDVSVGLWECDQLRMIDSGSYFYPSFVRRINTRDGIDNGSPLNWKVPNSFYNSEDQIRANHGLQPQPGHGSLIRDKDGLFFQWNPQGFLSLGTIGLQSKSGIALAGASAFYPPWEPWIISDTTDFPDVETTNNVQSITIAEIDPNSPEYGGTGGDGGGELNPGGSNILSRFTPRIATGNVGSYKLDANGVNTFLSELWNTDIIEQIRSSFIGDGSNALLGLRWFYGVGYNVPTASSSPINMGNVSFDDAGSFPVVSREFVPFYAGTITVPSTFGDYRDWTLRTFKVYVPFVGLIDVDANQVCNKTLALKYHVNLTDGSATVILANSTDFNDIIFTTSCSWGYDIPVRVEAVPDMTARIINATGIPSIIKAFGGMGGDQNYTTGELSPNSSVMGDFTPKLIIYTHNDVSGNLTSTVGKPSNTTQNVGSFSGYLKAQSVQVPASVQSVPAVHIDTIVTMLKDGVYV